MKLDKRILSHLFIGVDIDLFCYRIAVFIIVTFFLWNTIDTYGMQIKCCSLFNFMLFIFYFGKKAHASSICKRFLFPESNDPQMLLIPKVTRVATIGTKLQKLLLSWYPTSRFFLTFLKLLKYMFVRVPASVGVVLCAWVLSFLIWNIMYLNHAIELIPHYYKIWEAFRSNKPLGFSTGFLAKC